MKEQANNRRIGQCVKVITTEELSTKTEIKSFSIRQRNNKWEYRIEGKHINGKRHQITKCGFPTKEEAINAATQYIKVNMSKDIF